MYIHSHLLVFKACKHQENQIRDNSSNIKVVPISEKQTPLAALTLLDRSVQNLHQNAHIAAENGHKVWPTTKRVKVKVTS